VSLREDHPQVKRISLLLQDIFRKYVCRDSRHSTGQYQTFFPWSHFTWSSQCPCAVGGSTAGHVV